MLVKRSEAGTAAPLELGRGYPITRNKTVRISLSTVSVGLLGLLAAGEFGVSRPLANLEDLSKDEGKPCCVEKNGEPHEEEIQSTEPISPTKLLFALLAAEPARELSLVQGR